MCREILNCPPTYFFMYSPRFSWSYGVLLYEIFTLGDTPYPSVPQPDMLAHLESGNRLPKPDLFIEEMFVPHIFSSYSC
jgi:hypothetical protein